MGLNYWGLSFYRLNALDLIETVYCTSLSTVAVSGSVRINYTA